MVQKRLSSLSITEEIFERIKIPCEKALKNSGFKTPLSYVQDNLKESVKRKLRKKVFYYNPPFSNGVKTNIGKKKLKNSFQKFPNIRLLLFTRNTIKISYSCMPNLEKKYLIIITKLSRI